MNILKDYIIFLNNNSFKPCFIFYIKMVNHKCSIIANPDGEAWEYAQRIYDELSKRDDRFELNKAIIKRFRDGEIKPKIEKNIRERKCFFIHDSNLPPAEWFLQLCLVNEALANSSAYKIVDVLPYLKFSRQDRTDESRVSISAKVIADAIGVYADRVLTIDVHNPAIQGFYNIPFNSLYSFPTVAMHLRTQHPEILENLVPMSPDEGGIKRTLSFGKFLGLETMAAGYKVRKLEGEVERLEILGDVNGKKVILVDDMIDSGGTLIKAAQKAREKGATEVYAYATHGLFTEGTEKVTRCFNRLFVGDTRKQPSGIDAEIIPFSQLMAEAIYRTSIGESLSELFK